MTINNKLNSTHSQPLTGEKTEKYMGNQKNIADIIGYFSCQYFYL